MQEDAQEKKKFKFRLDIFLLAIFIALGLLAIGATLLGRYLSIKFLQVLSLKLFSPLGTVILFVWGSIAACGTTIELQLAKCCCARENDAITSQARVTIQSQNEQIDATSQAVQTETTDSGKASLGIDTDGKDGNPKTKIRIYGLNGEHGTVEIDSWCMPDCCIAGYCMIEKINDYSDCSIACSMTDCCMEDYTVNNERPKGKTKMMYLHGFGECAYRSVPLSVLGGVEGEEGEKSKGLEEDEYII
jgi:hypothetical protein